MVSEPQQPLGSARVYAHAQPLPGVPAPLTALLGREQELAAASALLLRDDVRLVTLTGPAGVGKTRLALELVSTLAVNFDNACQFISLAPATDPDEAFAMVAQSLGVREAAGQTLFASLVAYLRVRSMLLALDNLEHVLAVGPQLAELLELCRDISMLTTSRAALRLRGEQVVPVSPLAAPDEASLRSDEDLRRFPAVQLFAERAAAAVPDIHLSEAEMRVAGEICRRLDGLPLAIELAAAGLRVLSPAALLARLDHPLDTLTAGARDLPPRQRTLRSAIGWSYALLAPEEQTLFRRLGVFAGGCTLESAQAVCDSEGQLAGRLPECMAALVETNLLRRETTPSGDVRFAMLVTIREFALEQLAAAGEQDARQRRHAEWMLALAERAEEKPGQAGFDQWPRVDEALAEIRAALAWALARGETTIGLRIVGALTSYWESRGILTEAADRVEALLAQPGAGLDTQSQASALYALGRIRGNQGRLAEAVDASRRSVAAFRLYSPRDIRQIGPLSWMGCTIASQADAARFEEARAATEEALILARAAGDAHLLAQALQGRGFVAMLTGETERGRLAFAENEPLLRKLGDRHRLSYVLTHIGKLDFRQGKEHEARAHFTEAVALGRAIEDKGRIIHALIGLGYVALHAHDLPTATACFAESLALVRDTGTGYHLVALFEGWASLCSLRGRFEEAARLMGAAAAAYEANRAPPWPGSQSRYEETRRHVGTQLGGEAFAAQWAVGRALSLDEAAAEALRQATEDQAQADAEAEPHPAPPTLIRPAPSLPHHLTEREIEVLRLIAAGRSNREIATALVIAEGTVERHVTNLYGKIDARSRVDAAAYALRNGLA